jgi:predicted nucleotidyltransferase
VRSVRELTDREQSVLEELGAGIRQAFPEDAFHLTLFGSRARGDAEPDSDMDVLVEMERPHIRLAEKQRIQRIAGEISMRSGIILCLLLVDQSTREEKGDFSIFRNIQEHGIPV